MLILDLLDAESKAVADPLGPLMSHRVRHEVILLGALLRGA